MQRVAKDGGFVPQPANGLSGYIQELSTHRREGGRAWDNKREPFEGETPDERLRTDEGLRTKDQGVSIGLAWPTWTLPPSLGHACCMLHVVDEAVHAFRQL